MSKFIRKHLIANEEILHETHYHWVKYIRPVSLLSLFILPLIEHYTSEFAITDRRVISKEGWLNIRVEEISHHAIEAIKVDQSILGRMLDYGTVRIIGSGGTLKTYSNINAPMTFRKNLLHIQNN